MSISTRWLYREIYKTRVFKWFGIFYFNSLGPNARLGYLQERTSGSRTVFLILILILINLHKRQIKRLILLKAVFISALLLLFNPWKL